MASLRLRGREGQVLLAAQGELRTLYVAWASLVGNLEMCGLLVIGIFLHERAQAKGVRFRNETKKEWLVYIRYFVNCDGANFCTKYPDLRAIC